MSTTYAPKQAPAQKKDASSAASILDASSQSESLQRKADLANNAAQRAEAPRPNNTGMPDNLKSGIESLSGFSMDDVRVHYNSSKPATVQALAYTQGTDIHVAPGQEKHLPHEAWHVAQQMAGRVSPTTNINGMPVNDNAALEHEADVMGEKAVAQKKNIQSDSAPQEIKRNVGTIQRVLIGIDTSMNYNSYMILDSAIREILNEFYVRAIICAPYFKKDGQLTQFDCEDVKMSDDNYDDNWGDILITEGPESRFMGGKKAEREKAIELQMNLEQCNNLFFGNEDDLEQALINGSKGNQSIDSVLLHELGHAYQHYLKIKNKKTKIDSDPFIDLEEYPLLHECLFQIYSCVDLKKNRERLTLLHDVLKEYYPDKSFVISLFLDDPNNKYIHKLMIDPLRELMKIVGEGAANDNGNVEADNLVMNEIPFNKTNHLAVRKKYSEANDLRIWNFKNELIKQELSDLWEITDINKITKDNVEKIKDKCSSVKTLALKNNIYLDESNSTFWCIYLCGLIDSNVRIPNEKDEIFQIIKNTELGKDFPLEKIDVFYPGIKSYYQKCNRFGKAIKKLVIPDFSKKGAEDQTV